MKAHRGKKVLHAKAGGKDFFKHLPESARIFAIPYALSRQGVVKHGRHGDIHRRAVEWLERIARKNFPRIISVLIGDHTNIVAVKDGQPVDVSDGFLTTDGVFSRTGCGAIDSAIVFQLLADGMRPDRVKKLLSKQSGFKSLAGGNGRLGNIFRRKDRRAKFAREVFLYQLVKYVGAYIAVLGGVDAVLLIGEDQTAIRDLILELMNDLKFLGIKKKPAFAAEETALLTSSESKVAVYFSSGVRLPR